MVVISISKEQLANLEYDVVSISKIMPDPATVTAPTLLIVGDRGDLNAAAYHLAKSLEEPFAADAIVSVLVAEAVRPNFLERVRSQLKPISAEVAKMAQRQQVTKQILQNKWETIAASALGDRSPIIVCDVTHDHLGGTGYNGIVTLHTFRTVQEAISLSGKESLKFANVSIWHENHSCAYEIALKLKCGKCFINCFQVPMVPLQKASASEKNSCALVEHNYHYERLVLPSGTNCEIVFPIGTIITN